MVWLWIISAWGVLAVLVAVVFAAVGRNASREDQELGHPSPDPAERPWTTPRLVKSGSRAALRAESTAEDGAA